MPARCNQWDYVGIARLVLETTTALSIGQGPGPDLFDHQLASDANGLAAIPGSSLAGVLRHAWERTVHGQGEQANQSADLATDRWFGGIADQDTHSRIRVSWGCVHNQDDQPIEGLLFDIDDRLADDPILADARVDRAVKRNRVRINERGVAVDGAQFDRMVLRAGHRFSVEVSMWSPWADEQPWRRLLALFYHSEFRLGGAIRSGLGAFKVVRMHQRWFHLKQPKEFRAFSRLSQSLRSTEGLTREAAEQVIANETEIEARLELTPVDFLCVSGGVQSLDDAGEQADEPTNLNFVPVTEARVHWHQGQGSIDTDRPDLLIPGSSIKGAIRHRVAYHARILTEKFCIPEASPPEPTEEREAPERVLFGFANNTKLLDGESSGQCGRVIIDDVYVSQDQIQSHLLTHNSIDRFTGGVRNGALFTEQFVSCLRPISLRVRIRRHDKQRLETTLRRALRMTLEDLAEERLDLGSGANRGNGFFTGTLQWSDGGAWIEEPDPGEKPAVASAKPSLPTDHHAERDQHGTRGGDT